MLACGEGEYGGTDIGIKLLAVMQLADVLDGGGDQINHNNIIQLDNGTLVKLQAPHTVLMLHTMSQFS